MNSNDPPLEMDGSRNMIWWNTTPMSYFSSIWINVNQHMMGQLLCQPGGHISWRRCDSHPLGDHSSRFKFWIHQVSRAILIGPRGRSCSVLPVILNPFQTANMSPCITNTSTFIHQLIKPNYCLYICVYIYIYTYRYSRYVNVHYIENGKR